MKILALEGGASFWGLIVAEIEIESAATARPLALTIDEQPRSLARDLFARIQSSLDDAGVSLSDLNALAVGIGPGSWTGLRVGLTAMKTLAQVRGLPLAGVPSFDPVAQAVWRQRDAMNGNNHSTQLLLVAENCRPGELYGKVYECGVDYLSVIQEEWIGSPQLLADTLATEALARELDGTPILVGGAAGAVAEIFESRSEEYSVAEASREEIMIELALSGAVAIASDEAADPMSLAPLYLAPSNAERNLLGG